MVLPVDGLLDVADDGVVVARRVASEADSEVDDENEADEQGARWNHRGAAQLTS